MRFIVTILLFACTLVNAQQYVECEIANKNSLLSPQDYKNLKSIKGVSDFEPVTFNVYFWGFKRANNTGNVLFTQENIEASVARLNELYNLCDVSFVLLGYDTIRSEEFYTINSTAVFYDMLVDMRSKGYVNDQAFNIYVSNEYQGFGGIVEGYDTTTIGIPGVQLVNEGTLEHEMGHCFGLRHTNLNTNNITCGESVTRDPSNLYFNADLTGDFVVDTAACYEFEPGEFDPETCSLTSNTYDCYGFRYQVPSSLFNNYMTTGASECEKDHLTTGQFVRVQKTIALDPLNLFQAAIAD